MFNLPMNGLGLFLFQSGTAFRKIDELVMRKTTDDAILNSPRTLKQLFHNLYPGREA